MQGILEGIRIIDCTIWLQGPGATAMLADLGAEVIHVEQPGIGDYFRGLKTLFGVSLEMPGGRHALFEDNNRNKKGITVNLKNPKGREIIYRMAEKSDVFVTNLRPAAVDEFGLGYETVSRYNSRLIYAQASPFGLKGQDKDRPGLELLGCARSGIMMASGDEGMPPVVITAGVGDRIGAVYLAWGILAALLGRERLGVAQRVNASLLGSIIDIQCSSVVAPLLTGQMLPRFNRKKNKNPFYSLYESKDKKWMALTLLPASKYWPALCQALGRPELEKDPRFDTDDKRSENSEELISLIDEVFATKAYKEWENIFNRYDIMFTPVNTVGDLASDPQVLANDYIIEWDHPDFGKVKYKGFPIQFDKTPMVLREPAPHVGQHTEEVLLECGYSWEEIDKLRSEGAI